MRDDAEHVGAADAVLAGQPLQFAVRVLQPRHLRGAEPGQVGRVGGQYGRTDEAQRTGQLVTMMAVALADPEDSRSPETRSAAEMMCCRVHLWKTSQRAVTPDIIGDAVAASAAWVA